MGMLKAMIPFVGALWLYDQIRGYLPRLPLGGLGGGTAA